MRVQRVLETSPCFRRKTPRRTMYADANSSVSFFTRAHIALPAHTRPRNAHERSTRKRARDQRVDETADSRRARNVCS